MTSSASNQNDTIVLDTVPLDLLPIHQRLEDDGGSWRTTLPRTDKLLCRVRESPAHNPYADEAEPRSAPPATAFQRRPAPLSPRSHRGNISR